MASAKRLLEHLADDTAEVCEALDARITQLEQRSREDTTMILVLYEALLVATGDPGNPFIAAQKARDILALAGE